MRIVATLLAGLVLLLLEPLAASVLGLDVWLPHIALGLALALALDRDFTEGAFLLMALAWVADLASGAPAGLVAMPLSLVFLAVKGSMTRFTYRSRLVRVALAIVAAALLHALEFALAAGLTRELVLWPAFVRGALPSSLVAPVGLWLCRAVLGWLDARLRPRKQGLS